MLTVAMMISPITAPATVVMTIIMVTLAFTSADGRSPAVTELVGTTAMFPVTCDTTDDDDRVSTVVCSTVGDTVEVCDTLFSSCPA